MIPRTITPPSPLGLTPPRRQRWLGAAALSLVLMLYAHTEATAGPPTPASGPHTPTSLEPVVSSGISLYLSDARTQGGFGPGAGVRAYFNSSCYIQVDTRYLLLLGQAMEVRLSAGLERNKLWAQQWIVSRFRLRVRQETGPGR